MARADSLTFKDDGAYLGGGEGLSASFGILDAIYLDLNSLLNLDISVIPSVFM